MSLTDLPQGQDGVAACFPCCELPVSSSVAKGEQRAGCIFCVSTVQIFLSNFTGGCRVVMPPWKRPASCTRP